MVIGRKNVGGKGTELGIGKHTLSLHSSSFNLNRGKRNPQAVRACLSKEPTLQSLGNAQSPRDLLNNGPGSTCDSQSHLLLTNEHAEPITLKSLPGPR